jgi:putative membrane protein insertion efficiency factor
VQQEERRVADGLRSVLLRLVTAPIRLYQSVISPALPPRCKYEPSCSAYALSALRAHGLIRGTILAAWRLLRCNPFSHGGFDPVEAQTLFRRNRPELDSPTSHSAERERDGQGALV